MLNRDLTFWDDFVGQLMQIHNTLLYILPKYNIIYLLSEENEQDLLIIGGNSVESSSKYPWVKFPYFETSYSYEN